MLGEEGQVRLPSHADDQCCQVFVGSISYVSPELWVTEHLLIFVELCDELFDAF